ncbi:hypothetical protein CAPTEDRAFT_164017 [Capitella teleta]|uniref:Vacuolar fusion protein MON1 homolog n=1 Tax=Capitella teleta TaxID=283909 RepID=R7TQ94_CAPTE|nr:hypothetical protein CAPTEDRAFT_164017 [Capitella teleta]|eukprot:ELT95737.1 hypothetical protein CAPTEDRAFT_164017 [Capitella teleta]
MAAEISNDSPSDEILQGSEPGASRNSMLLATDSYDDLASYLSDTNLSSDRDRLSSGSISEITHPTETESFDPKSVISEEVGPEVVENEINEQLENSLDVSASPVDEPAALATSDSDTVTERIGLDTPTSQLSELSTDHSQPEACTGNNSDEQEEEVEYVHSQEWRQHRKHVFILSQSGKPIYSRHGDEDRLVTLMGVMQALVSVIGDGQDLLRCITAGSHKMVFLIRENLVLVAAARSIESMPQLLLQLTYVYNQVLSVLTLSQLSRIFKQRRNYDLRRLLTGAEKFFDNLLNTMDRDPCFFLGAVRCLPLESSMRDTIAQSIAQNAKVKDLVFAILIADNQLITLVRMKKYFLHPLDLHLIFNLVSASESFKAAESWTPICLPKFDSGGYLHAHISYMDEECRSCLLLLTVDRDVFFTLSECKEKIRERLVKYKCLAAIAESVDQNGYKTSQVGIPELRHFLYKSRSAAQFSCPEYEAPYHTADQRDRLFGLYQFLHHRIHSSSRPLKILFHVGSHETLLGWVTSGFELYAVFGPLVTKSAAINSVNKLLKWIKKEEDRFFILNSPTF